MVSAGGARAALGRAVLAALIAEITVPLAERPWDFFEHTDLLDFPGARSREEITDPAGFLAQPGRLGRVFLRGKVAYLFQRYNDEQEIAAMLLCVGPSNQDVQTLPRMITDWIGLTIGATPAARAAQRNSLFFVLTQFDREFEEKAGEDAATGQRWSARLQASLLEFFGKSHDWPTDWAPGRAFDNLFWLRSTAIGFDTVLDYATVDGVKRETGVAPRAQAKVAEKRAAYLQTPEVLRHFADPARAWEEGLRPGDGGISYLAEPAAPGVRPVHQGGAAVRAGGGAGDRHGAAPAAVFPHRGPGRRAGARQEERARRCCAPWRNARRRRCSAPCCARCRSRRTRWPPSTGAWSPT